MDEKKQIEKMAFDLIMATSPLGVKDLTKEFDYNTVATDLYKLYGWRKQNEIIPCGVGQTVYKICPKCNERHNGSCEHCAWSGCQGYGCDIGVRVYSDGSHGKYDLQIVPRKVLKHTIITICELWNIMYFATEEEANTAKSEYEAIRNIKDRHERYEAYKAWASKREMHYAFSEGGAEE